MDFRAVAHQLATLPGAAAGLNYVAKAPAPRIKAYS
jgi:hypothetical protein